MVRLHPMDEGSEGYWTPVDADDKPRISHRIDERRNLALLNDQNISTNVRFLRGLRSYEKLSIYKDPEEVVVLCELHRSTHAT